MNRSRRTAPQRMTVLVRHCMLLALLLAALPAPAAAGFGSFAECIKRSGAVLYDAHWCGNCVNQRNMFRGYANRLKVVQCYAPGDSKNMRKACEAAGVSSFPTWIFADGTKRIGGLGAEDLAGHTGCALP